MTRVTRMRTVTVGIILVAALLSLLLVFTLRGGSTDNLGSFFPGITLATEAEAAALAQAVPALNTEKVGMLAYLDLDIDGDNPFGLQPGVGDTAGFLNTVREHLLDTKGIGSAVEVQDNFVQATWCVPNRVSCITIHLFVASDGNIVAFLPRGTASAAIWQAAALDIQFPQLTDDTFDTNLVGGVISPGGFKEVLGLFPTKFPDGINTVIPGGAIKLKDKITWFNFGFPLADRMLMIGKAIGQPSTQVVNIALPPAVQAGVAEVSFYAYGLGASNCCPDGKSTLDGAVLFHDTRLDDPSHKSGFVNLTNFKTTQAHALVVKLESSTGNTGSTGIALMILYDAFDAP